MKIDTGCDNKNMGYLKRVVKAPSTDDTTKFYTELVSGAAKRGLWGKEKRFNPLQHVGSENIEKHFVASVTPFISPEDNVLDLGCGSGIFLTRVAKLCRKVIGADISKSFIEIANGAIEKLQLRNAEAVAVERGALNFENATFDAVLMVDVIHHLEDIDGVLNETHRVLKQGGKLLLFEPNKLNPALLLMCVFDRNEWGLLSLGTKRAYDKILASRFKVEYFSFSGLLIGPDSRLAFAIANFLLMSPYAKVLRFFSPKLFIMATAL